jgi:sec-independent protein translocase protein TatA
MPSIGFGEIIILVLIGLIVFGPKRLPEIGRTVGKSMREFRRAAADLRAEIEEDVDEGRPRFPARSGSPAGEGDEPPPELPPT